MKKRLSRYSAQRRMIWLSKLLGTLKLKMFYAELLENLSKREMCEDYGILWHKGQWKLLAWEVSGVFINLKPSWSHLKTDISSTAQLRQHRVELDTVLCNKMVQSSKKKIKPVCLRGHSNFALGVHGYSQGCKKNKHSTKGPPRD